MTRLILALLLVPPLAAQGQAIVSSESPPFSLSANACATNRVATGISATGTLTCSSAEQISQETKITRAANTACASGGTAMFIIPYNNSGSTHFRGTLYAVNNGTTAWTFSCVASNSVAILYLDARGGINTGTVYGMTSAASDGTAAASLTLTIGGNYSVQEIRGSLINGAGNPAGTITCSCAASGSNVTLRAGSYVYYAKDL